MQVQAERINDQINAFALFVSELDLRVKGKLNLLMQTNYANKASINTGTTRHHQVQTSGSSAKVVTFQPAIALMTSWGMTVLSQAS